MLHYSCRIKTPSNDWVWQWKKALSVCSCAPSVVCTGEARRGPRAALLRSASELTDITVNAWTLYQRSWWRSGGGGKHQLYSTLGKMTSLCAAALSAKSLRPFGSKSVAIVSRSLLHTTSANAATPLSHPAAPGPPPKPPLPAVTQPAERLARKKRQAELLKRGQELKTNPAKPGSALQKRFWKNVDVKETSGMRVTSVSGQSRNAR